MYIAASFTNCGRGRWAHRFHSYCGCWRTVGSAAESAWSVWCSGTWQDAGLCGQCRRFAGCETRTEPCVGGGSDSWRGVVSSQRHRSRRSVSSCEALAHCWLLIGKHYHCKHLLLSYYWTFHVDTEVVGANISIIHYSTWLLNFCVVIRLLFHNLLLLPISQHSAWNELTSHNPLYWSVMKRQQFIALNVDPCWP